MAHLAQLSFSTRCAALLAAGLVLAACGRTDAPSDQVAPAAREAASSADAIVVPPVPQASEPAASQPAAPASPVSSIPAPTSSTAAIDVDGLKLTGAAAPAAGASPAGGAGGAAAGGSGGAAPYKVVDGTKVDPVTMEGFRTWRAAACDRCHGANQEGMVGPSLIASLKVLTKEQFEDVILNGRLAKGMPSFKSSEMVTKNIDGLYAYLKGRSDGAITEAKVQPIQ